jgi:hypothetical protein
MLCASGLQVTGIRDKEVSRHELGAPRVELPVRTLTQPRGPTHQRRHTVFDGVQGPGATAGLLSVWHNLAAHHGIDQPFAGLVRPPTRDLGQSRWKQGQHLGVSCTPLGPV